MFRIAICDDEPEICSQIHEIISDYSQESHESIEIHPFCSGEELWFSMTEGLHFDLIFLDIELKLLNGINIGKKIREELGDETVQIVYISSKQGYAMALFETRPLHFLVKPLNPEQIIQVVKKSQELNATMNQLFEFRVGNSYQKVPQREIIYFESIGKKIHIITTRGTLEFYGKLSEVCDSVPDNEFLLVHQSYLINYCYISEYQYEQLTLSNGASLPISQAYRKAVRERLLARKRGG